MIIGIGCDIIQIERIKKLCQKQESAFLNYVFSKEEQEQALSLSDDKRYAFLAKRFSAKEAFSKALGVGIGHQAHWQDIVVKKNQQGVPQIELRGQAYQTLLKKTNHHAFHIHLSLSDDQQALAYVVIEQLD